MFSVFDLIVGYARVPLLTEQLQSTCAELVEAIGEAFATLNDVDDQFQVDDAVISIIEDLSTENNKHKVGINVISV